MFAYCANNPANAIDPLGEYAIWLQELNNRASLIAGHTALLIQDADGNWHYFNWNNTSCTLSHQGTINYNGMSSLPPFIREKYDSAIYFEGDFSASVDYVRTLKKKYSPDDYDVFWNNCMQVSVDVLMRGKFAKSDWCYESFLYRVRNTIIPNIAYSRMVNFHSAVQTYHAAPKWAKWLYTSPERAVQIY